MNPSISSVREVEVECSDQALWESHSSLLIHYYDAASLVTFFFSLYLSLSHCATRGIFQFNSYCYYIVHMFFLLDPRDIQRGYSKQAV